jgi:hypothetical protein
LREDQCASAAREEAHAPCVGAAPGRVKN